MRFASAGGFLRRRPTCPDGGRSIGGVDTASEEKSAGASRSDGTAVAELALSHLLVRSLLTESAALTVAVDDTLFKRSGKKVFAAA